MSTALSQPLPSRTGNLTDDNSTTTYVPSSAAVLQQQQRHKSNVIVLLCAGCSFLSYIDRTTLSVAVIPMADELNWSLHDKAAALGAFFHGYVCSQVLGAYLAARFGPKIILAMAVTAWSLVTILTPMAARISPNALVIARILLGLSEGLCFPCVFHVIAQHVPKEGRSRAIALIQAGNGAGAVAALAASPVLVVRAGWPSVFYTTGVLGLVWAAVWLSVVDPRPSVRDGTVLPSEKVEAGGSRDGSSGTISGGESGLEFVIKTVVQCARSPAVLVIMLAHFTNNFGGYLFMTWMPTLLSDRYGINGENLWITVSTPAFRSPTIIDIPCCSGYNISCLLTWCDS